MQPGQKVLINGASGGVGTHAVQIAKALGAGRPVCSTRNVEQARALGADRVVDYTQEDFTKLDLRHDLLIDIAGSKPFRKLRRVLTPEATVVIVGAKFRAEQRPRAARHVIRMRLGGIARSQKVKFFIAKITKDDLAVLQELLDSGKVKSVIDKTYEPPRSTTPCATSARATPAEKSSSPCERRVVSVAHCQRPEGGQRMGVKPIPEGYHTLTAVLAVEDAAAAIDFYKQAFGAKERMRMDAPGGKIAHAELEIGDSLIMLSDRSRSRTSSRRTRPARRR